MEGDQEKEKTAHERAVESGRKGGLRNRGRKRREKTQLLKDIQHVYTKDRKYDKTPAHRKLREEYDLNFSAFFSKMSTLEGKWYDSLKKEPLVGAGTDAPLKDEGTELAMELLERWLREWNEQNK